MIEWIEYPKFQIITSDLRFNKFKCTKAGEAILHYKGDRYLLSFELDWVTDFTSSPLFLRSFVPQMGEHSLMSLVHDLCLQNLWPRSLAHYAMVCQGVLSVDYWKDQCEISEHVCPDAHRDNIQSYGLIKKRSFIMKYGLKGYDLIIGDWFRDGLIVAPAPMDGSLLIQKP